MYDETITISVIADCTNEFWELYPSEEDMEAMYIDAQKRGLVAV